MRVPFRILTEEEEEKFLSKNYGDIEKQVEGRVQEEEVTRLLQIDQS